MKSLSTSISSTITLSVQSDEEKERRRSSVSIGCKDFEEKKIERKFSHELLHPIMNDSEEALLEKVRIESVARRHKQKNEEIGFRKKKNEVDVATSSWKHDQCTKNETDLTELSHPTASFSLSYVNCYDGGANRYYAKNILRLNSCKIIFPAANIAVLMDTESSEQGFFTGHTDIISSLCLHPDKRIVASGQSGGLILVWDSELLQLKERMSESLIQLNGNGNENENENEESHQNIECLSFSADGVFLVALISGCCGSSKGISIFKWIDGITVASALVGHSTIQVSFDPYKNPIIEETIRSKDMKNEYEGNDDREVHHSLVTVGGRVIKFWTFHERCDKNRKVEISRSNYDNSSSSRDGYLLEGRCGVWPGGNEFSTCDLTCFTFISCHDSMMNNTNENKGVKKASRLFCGSSTGSIFLWELTEYKKENVIQGIKSLVFKEKLLSVVTDVHEGSLFDIDYHSNVLNNHKNHDNHDNCKLTIFKDSILTCGADGMVNLWQIEKIKCSPLIHLAVYSLLGIDSEHNGIVKTVVFSNDGLNATAGTSNGSLIMLSLNSNQGDITARNILPS